MLSSVLGFFEFGAGEIMFIMLVALLLFGGDKLPELARGLGKGIRDFKDASDGVKREITSQIDNFEAKKTAQPASAEITDTKPVETKDVVVNRDEYQSPFNSVPVSEIGIAAAVEPVKEQTPAAAEPAHLRETPIEPQSETPKAEHREA